MSTGSLRSMSSLTCAVKKPVFMIDRKQFTDGSQCAYSITSRSKLNESGTPHLRRDRPTEKKAPRAVCALLGPGIDIDIALHVASLWGAVAQGSDGSAIAVRLRAKMIEWLHTGCAVATLLHMHAPNEDVHEL